MARKYNS